MIESLIALAALTAVGCFVIGALRRRNPQTARKSPPGAYVCSQCNEQDCVCEKTDP